MKRQAAELKAFSGWWRVCTAAVEPGPAVQDWFYCRTCRRSEAERLDFYAEGDWGDESDFEQAALAPPSPVRLHKPNFYHDDDVLASPHSDGTPRVDRSGTRRHSPPTDPLFEPVRLAGAGPNFCRPHDLRNTIR